MEKLPCASGGGEVRITHHLDLAGVGPLGLLRGVLLHDIIAGID